MADSLLAYVLLVGDAFDPAGNVVLPTYYGFAADSTNRSLESASDAFYSFLSDSLADDDLFADVYIGRLPVDAVSLDTPPDPDWELRNIVTKIKTYQRTSVDPQRVLLVSGGDENTLPKPLRNYFGYLLNNVFPASADVDTLNRRDYPDENEGVASPKDFEFSARLADTLVVNDYWVVGYFDHGTPYYWPETFFATDFDTLQNQSWPLMFVFGSNTGRFDLPQFNEAPPDSMSCLRLSAGPGSTLHTPTAKLDTCDVFDERILTQENGAIGVIGFSRSYEAVNSDILFNAFWRALYEDNAYSLGEMLLSTRLFTLPAPDSIAERALMIFGDPALNIMYENGLTEADSVDLLIAANDIEVTNALKGKYLAGDPVLRFTVQNKLGHPAYNVAYEVWDGAPPGGDEVFSGTLLQVDAFGSYTEEITIQVGNGVRDIFVVVDTTAFPEPTIQNNIARTTVYAYQYENGFPISLDAAGQHSITISDISAGASGKEILFNAGSSLRCYSANGNLLWSQVSNTNPTASAVANGTPIVSNLFKDGVPHTIFIDEVALVLDGQGAVVDTIDIEGDSYWATESNSARHAQVLALADLVPGDSSLELIVKSRPQPQGFGRMRVRAFNLDGAKLWERPVGGPASGFDDLELATGDLDGDGTVEVLVRTNAVGGGSDSLYCFGPGGEIRWPAQEVGNRNNPDGNHSLVLVPSPSVLGKMEVITTGDEVTELAGTRIVKFSSNGTLQDIAHVSGRIPFLTASSLGSPSNLRYVVGFDDRLSVFNSSGVELYSEALDSLTMSIGVPLLANLAPSPEFEIVSYKYYYTESDKHRNKGAIVIRNSDLSVRETLEFPGTKVHGLNPSARYSIAEPAVDDIDGDGQVELAFVSFDSTLHVIEIGTASGDAAWPQRYGNPMQTNSLEQPLVGSYDEPVSLVNDVVVYGDVTFDSTLYVDGTADIVVSLSDATSSGLDSTQCEFIVRGAAQFVGSAGDTITMRPDTTDVTASYWYGVYIDSTSTSPAEISYCSIQGARIGIKTSRAATVENCVIEGSDAAGIAGINCDSLSIDGTTISNTSGWGVYLTDAAAPPDLPVEITGSVISSSQTDGIVVQPGVQVDITGTAFENNGTGLYVAGKVTMIDCVVDGNTSYGGEVQAGGDLTATGTIFSNSIHGLNVAGTATLVSCSLQVNTGAGVLVQSAGSLDASNTVVKGNATGLYLVGDCTYTGGAIEGSSGNGVMVSTTGDLDIDGSEISDNADGLSVFGSLAMRNCTVEDNSNTGLTVAGADTVVVDSTTVTGSDIGISHTDGGWFELSNSIVDNHEFYGTQVSSGATLVATNTTFRYSDTGIYISRGDSSFVTATLDACRFEEDSIGVATDDLTGASNVFIWAGVVMDNHVAGVHCQDGGNIVLRNNLIKNNPTGVLASGAAPKILRGNNVRDNSLGLKFDDFADAVVESTEVHQNVNGIEALNGSNPDVGHTAGGQSVGFNKIHHNSVYHIINLTDSVTIKAEKNWWRGTTPKATKFVGDVDYIPVLASEPDIHYEDPPSGAPPAPMLDGPKKERLVYALSHGHPTPFNPSTTIHYQIPASAVVSIKVYDVKGRRIATLVDAYKTPGRYWVRWDGKNDRGTETASGVYFVDMRANQFRQTRKVVLLK